MEYTKGEWKARDSSAGGLVMAGLFPYVVGSVEGTIAKVATEANAQRIVDCVNGCKNIENPLAVGDLYEACYIAINEIERLAMVTGYEGEAHFPRIAQIKQAIAKAKEE